MRGISLSLDEHHANENCEPFPRNGAEEVLRRLENCVIDNSDAIVTQTDSLQRIKGEDHPVASEWWDSVVDWNINARKRIDNLAATIGRKSESYRIAVWAYEMQNAFLRQYICNAWNMRHEDWCMWWNYNENMHISNRWGDSE